MRLTDKLAEYYMCAEMRKKRILDKWNESYREENLSLFNFHLRKYRKNCRWSNYLENRWLEEMGI